MFLILKLGKNYDVPIIYCLSTIKLRPKVSTSTVFDSNISHYMNDLYDKTETKRLTVCTSYPSGVG